MAAGLADRRGQLAARPVVVNSAGRQDPQFYLMRTASDVLVTVELFLNARYGYDTRCEVVMEAGTSALTLPLTSSPTSNARPSASAEDRLPQLQQHLWHRLQNGFDWSAKS